MGGMLIHKYHFVAHLCHNIGLEKLAHHNRLRLFRLFLLHDNGNRLFLCEALSVDKLESFSALLLRLFWERHLAYRLVYLLHRHLMGLRLGT